MGKHGLGSYAPERGGVLDTLLYFPIGIPQSSTLPPHIQGGGKKGEWLFPSELTQEAAVREPYLGPYYCYHLLKSTSPPWVFQGCGDNSHRDSTVTAVVCPTGQLCHGS